MTAPARFKKEDIKRAISGALAAGIRQPVVELYPDGRMVISSQSAARPVSGGNPWDAELVR